MAQPLQRELLDHVDSGVLKCCHSDAVIPYRHGLQRYLGLQIPRVINLNASGANTVHRRTASAVCQQWDDGEDIISHRAAGDQSKSSHSPIEPPDFTIDFAHASHVPINYGYSRCHQGEPCPHHRCRRVTRSFDSPRCSSHSRYHGTGPCAGAEKGT